MTSDARVDADVRAADAAERAVLGAILRDPGLIAVASDTIGPWDFETEIHGRIFATMLALYGRDVPPDVVMIKSEDPTIDTVVLADLMTEVEGPGYLQAYCQHVAKASRARKAQAIGTLIVQAAHRSDLDTVRRLTAELDAITSEAAASPIGGEIVWSRFSDIEEEAIEWVWPNWIPSGKLSLCAGVQGDGKSTVLTSIAGALSSGGTLPNGARVAPKRVGFLISEDGVADTVKPRLRLHGANMDNVLSIDGVRTDDGEQLLSLAAHLPLLEQFVVNERLDVLIVDALSDFLGPIRRNDDGEVRSVLTPLAQMAGRTKCAVVGIVHLGKPGASARRAVERVLGSGAFTQVARIVLAVSTDPEDETRRYFGQVKNNIAPEAPTLSWYRDRDQPITWEGAAQTSVKHIMSGSHEKTTKADAARMFLEEFLKGGGQRAADVFKVGRERGIGRDALYAAAEELDVTKEKESAKQGHTWWRLPTGSPLTPDMSSGSIGSLERLESSGSLGGLNNHVDGKLPKHPSLPDVPVHPDVPVDPWNRDVLHGGRP